MNKMIIVSAPSGAGKTTLVQELLNENDFELTFSVSATSRKPREHEKNGVEYYFLEIETFKDKIEKDEFVEWQEVYSNQFYGTLKSEIERIWKLEKNIVFDVDVKGGINLKKYFNQKALSIFIMPPSIEELKQRLEKRGTETIQSIQKRISKAEYEIKFAKNFDVIIVNDKLETAINEIKHYVKNFLL